MKLHLKFLSTLLLTLVLSASAGQAQNKVYAAIGLNASYAPLDSLNYIIDQFNLENPTADKAMSNVHLPMGLDAHLGANLNRILFDLNFTMRLWAGTAKSEMLSNGQQTITKLQYNASTFDVGLGYFFLNGDYSQLALGASLDFGQMRVGARRGSRDQVSTQPPGRVVNELNLGASIFAQAMFVLSDAPHIGLYVRPYYQFGFFENDFGPANRFIRPQTSLSGPFYIYERPSNFGLKVGIYFGG